MKHQTHLSKSLWLLPTETYAGDPEKCSRMDDSPDDPGISNAWGSSDARGASGGGPSRSSSVPSSRLRTKATHRGVECGVCAVCFDSTLLLLRAFYSHPRS